MASLRWRTEAIERTPCDLSCLSAIRDNFLLCLWPSKRKWPHCGESTGKSDQDSVTKYHQFRSVVVYSNPACSCWFLESASEVKQRENDEKLKSPVHYIVFCGKQNILLRSHPNEKVNQASNSFSPQQCKWWSWNCAGWQGSRISREFHCFVKFQAQADDAALLRNFHCNTYWQRGKQVKHLSPKIQNELTDCWRKALALASAGGCKISIRIKYNNVFVPLSDVHPPTLLSCVSLPTQRNSAN